MNREPIGSSWRWLDSWFEIKERGSTVWTEVFAGITTYLSLSFVFILNPAILGASLPDSRGLLMSPQSILMATVIASASATISMGVFANLPLAVGPGIEVSAFFTYVLVRQMGLEWEQALLAVVVSGALNIVLTRFSIRERIVESIPPGLKSSLLLAIGVFVFLVGLKLGNFVEVGRRTHFLFLTARFWLPGNLRQGPTVLLVGLAISSILNIRRLKLPWGTLLGIVGAAIVCHMVGLHIGTGPRVAANGWTHTVFAAFSGDAWAGLLKRAFWSGVMIMFVIDFVGGISKIYALTEGTHILKKNNKVPGLRNALFVDGGATVLGGALGTSSLIAFVESRIGIQAGGQTGLTAIVCGTLMLLGGLVSSVLVLVPPEAASGPLIYVGILLIGLNWKQLKEHGLTRKDHVFALLMSLLVFLTFQFEYAMLFGFSFYFIKAFKKERELRSTFWLGAVAICIFLTIIPDLWNVVVNF